MLLVSRLCPQFTFSPSPPSPHRSSAGSPSGSRLTPSRCGSSRSAACTSATGPGMGYRHVNRRWRLGLSRAYSVLFLSFFHLLFPTRPLLHHRPTPNKKKHPAEKFRMRALGVRHRHPKAASDDAEEQLLRSANASRDFAFFWGSPFVTIGSLQLSGERIPLLRYSNFKLDPFQERETRVRRPLGSVYRTGR